MLERYYTVREVSEATGVPVRTLYDAIARGDLQRLVPHGCVRGWRLSEQAVRDWLGGDGKTPRATLADGGAGRQTRVPGQTASVRSVQHA